MDPRTEGDQPADSRNDLHRDCPAPAEQGDHAPREQRGPEGDPVETREIALPVGPRARYVRRRRRSKFARALMKRYEALVPAVAVDEEALAAFQPDPLDVAILHSLAAGETFAEDIADRLCYQVSVRAIGERLLDPLRRAWYAANLPVLIERESLLLCAELIGAVRRGNWKAARVVATTLFPLLALHKKESSARKQRTDFLKQLKRLLHHDETTQEVDPPDPA